MPFVLFFSIKSVHTCNLNGEWGRKIITIHIVCVFGMGRVVQVYPKAFSPALMSLMHVVTVGLSTVYS